MAYKHLAKPKAMVLQTTSVYNCSQSKLSGCMGVGADTASDKSPAQLKGLATWDFIFSMCTATANGS